MTDSARRHFIEFVPDGIEHRCQAVNCVRPAVYRTGIPYSRYFWLGMDRRIVRTAMRRWACEPHGVKFALKYGVKLPIEIANSEAK